MLRTLPIGQALDLLQRLRTATQPETPLSSSMEREYHPRRSEASSPRFPPLSLVPGPSGIEFELTTRYPIAYPDLRPVDVASSSLLDAVFGSTTTIREAVRADVHLGRCVSNLQQRFLTTYISNAGFSSTSPPSRQQDFPAIGPDELPSDGQGIASPPPQGQSLDLLGLPIDMGTEPSPSLNSYCDARLVQLDLSQWSGVTMDDALAARIVSFYLQTDHPLLGLFDSDLFLHDLLSLEQSFCSPMLLNAVMAWASVSSHSHLNSPAGDMHFVLED